MNIVIYMVRHAESPYTEGNERTCGRTAKGKADAEKVRGCDRNSWQRDDVHDKLF